jgi:2-polyprenyl-3-methyl-5-hydroxy-6-metoxy-1,4-benzoquinol methylase
MNAQDDIGYQTLEVISKADKFNRWMYDTIRPYCHGNILEIGSGIGNISKFFIQNGSSITLSDTDESYFKKLKTSFSKTNIASIDLVDENFTGKYSHLFQKFDTVIFLNVLEHVNDDGLAIDNCKQFLKQGGSLVILVPAYSFLYSLMDKELHHHRRYTAKKLSALVSEKKLIVKKLFYFNALGIFAWMYGKIFKLNAIPSKKMNLFNQLVPVAKLMDRMILSKAGLSVIIVAQKDL